MGTTRKNIRKDRPSDQTDKKCNGTIVIHKVNDGSGKTRNYRSKGDRLGWVLIKEAKTVSLEHALSSGKVVCHNLNYEPLLVP